MKGYIHVYTGDGKGKTTAAIGLSLRAAGAGLHVYFAQFLKQGNYSELIALKRFSDKITVQQFGTGRFVKGNPSIADKDSAHEGLNCVKRAMFSDEFQMIVMDEVNLAVYFNIIEETHLLEMLNQKPEDMELIITGRNATPTLIERADLVTEMKAIKHYYSHGVVARVGIEK
ncbi:MAG: cob(I)yrinic acid a,c-diamide adenosyltransferase [Desulfobacterales bacterium]|nr:cob(I)yrinic acid a,c-diamide adenosyltransferase [Desulfobacterales bacterium]